MSSSPACKIFLRHDQHSQDVAKFNNKDVAIYAFSWIQEGLDKLSQKLRGTRFEISERGKKDDILDEFVIGSTLNLTELQKIARNEPSNTSGAISWSQYSSGGLNDKEVLLAIKDLVRQSVIAGKDEATHYGGYPVENSRVPLNPSQPIYICDLAGLQFQQNYNTGRLVLIHRQNSPQNEVKGLLDDFIFEHVVGERRKTFEEALQLEGKRYITARNDCLFDTYAYQKFVAGDVILTGLAFADVASKSKEPQPGINFKFLKYGTGFFAGPYQSETNRYILGGILQGLETLFHKYGENMKGVIGHVEFPFYAGPNKDEGNKLKDLGEKHNFTWNFTRNDALLPRKKGSNFMITATTNCGDTMAVIGNEMRFGSVDAAIAENLRSKGNIFCPILNPAITETFFTLKA